MAKPRVKRKRSKIRRGCDLRTPGGVCRAIVDECRVVVGCPPERAKFCAPGDCCHHPFFVTKEKLSALKRAGVKLDRYRAKLRDPKFVTRLYSAFLKARSKRAIVSSKTSRLS